METQEVAAVDVSRIEQTLVKANVTKAVLSKLKADYGGLVKGPIQTQEEYEVIHRAQLECRNIRTLAVSICKKGREQAILEQKGWIQKEKEVVGHVEEVEGPLKKAKDDWNNAAEVKANEEAKAWAEKMQLRKEAVFDVGFTFNGQYYICDKETGQDPWVLREDQIVGMAMSEETLMAFLDTVREQLRITREIKAEADAKYQEEADKLEAQKQAEVKRIADAQAEVERKQRELAEKEQRLNAQLNNSRRDELMVLGCGTTGDGFIVTGGPHPLRMEVAVLHQMTEEEFVTWKKMAVIEVEAQKKKEELAATEAREQNRIREEERVARDAQMRKDAEAKAVKEERERVAREAEQQRAREIQAQADEAERQAKLTDHAKLKEYQQAILAIVAPTMTSTAGQAAMDRIQSVLANLLKKPQ